VVTLLSTRLLVVEDEPALLRLFQQYLSRLGYEVYACSSAGQALEWFAANPFRYPLVLADLNLPGMSGTELVTQLFRLNPDISILLCSGYPFDLSSLPAGVQGRIRFLQKPFLPKVLHKAIKELLDRRVSSD
jgi:CheY-like chemotaxis protein